MNGPTPNHVDALGKSIELDKIYGYSSQDGSWGTVVTGKVVKLNEKKVTLQVLTRRRFLYGQPSDYMAGNSDKVHIQSYHLFPVTHG